ncbi:2Fe-2S iron-sulfur cluster-binding protein, partial [Lysinibacillus sp. D4B1_S16]|uniref:2Fe-2S iron-sulfur cluster-binding protein n=1 Tax=Lysinibacillus sp. D4B1_S16 TaxID=2941231 RepID=UPI0020C0E258
MTQLHINGVSYDVKEGATILDTINQHDIPHPQICHVPTVDPIETCDTCTIEVNGQLVRSCS